MANVLRARVADKSFLTLSLIALGELSEGVLEAGGAFAKRWPSAHSVVVGSDISDGE
jgi:hypothetical protein